MSDRKQVIICPTCGRENDIGPVMCKECGSLLRGYTTTVPVDPNIDERRVAPPRPPGLLSDSVAFFIGGEAEPVVVSGEDKITLGRSVYNSTPPTVDLAPYRGYELGVSRHHAFINRSSEGYVIEDLGSTNGTWLNEKRLVVGEPHVLRNGDQIRIGHLIMFVYFYYQE